MSRLLNLAALAAFLVSPLAVVAQDEHSSGRNFYRSSRYTYSDSAWCAPGPGRSFYCYPKGQFGYSRGEVGAYPKNTWRHGLYRSNASPTGNIVR